MINKDYGFDDPQKRKETLELIKKVVNDHKNNLKLELTVKALSMMVTLVDTQEQIIEDQAERIAIMEAEMPGWISVDEKMPDNAKHKGAFCPRYRVLTKWGETVGWYNPDKGWWYFLLWYTDGVGVDFEHGDDPKLAHEKNGAKVVTHWMPMQELPKEGDQ